MLLAATALGLGLVGLALSTKKKLKISRDFQIS
jgi:hypothetical protein